MRRTLFASVASLILTASAAPPARDESLRAFLQMRFQEVRAGFPETTYTSAFADLNGDGRAEALVYLYSGYFCGSGGCDLFVFTPAGAGWRQLAEISVGRTPIRLLNTRRRGWRDIGVLVADMEGPREVRVSFNGQTYGPDSAPLRGQSPGRLLIAVDAEGRSLF